MSDGCNDRALSQMKSVVRLSQDFGSLNKSIGRPKRIAFKTSGSTRILLCHTMKVSAVFIMVQEQQEMSLATVNIRGPRISETVQGIDC